MGTGTMTPRRLINIPHADCVQLPSFSTLIVLPPFVTSSKEPLGSAPDFRCQAKWSDRLRAATARFKHLKVCRRINASRSLFMEIARLFGELTRSVDDVLIKACTRPRLYDGVTLCRDSFARVVIHLPHHCRVLSTALFTFHISASALSRIWSY